MLRVCFTTPGILPMLRRAAGTVYGGSELRAWRFARGLADLGFDVSIAARDPGPLPTDVLGPVRVHGVARNDGWLSSVVHSLGRGKGGEADLWAGAGADIFVSFGAAEYNADLASWCRANDRPLVLFAGSDADFSADYRPGNTARNIWGSRCDRCYDSVMGAAVLVVQTETQRRWAKERYGREADVVANPVSVADLAHEMAGEGQFLWIGKAVKNKRPDLALAVARACPEQPFVMILNDVGNGLFEEIIRDKGSNVEVVRSVPPDQLKSYFERARALLCTSDFEGFPNTFLDAGCFAVPVLSLSVDPDGLVAREQGGVVASGNMDRLIEAVMTYARQPETARAAGRRWYDYVRRNHDFTERVAEFAVIIRKATEARSAARELS